MSLFDWFSKIWRSWSTGRPKPEGQGSETTVDFPTVPANFQTSTSTILPASGSLQLRFGVATTIGHVREHNEDAYFVPVRLPSSGAPPNRNSNDSTASDESPRSPGVPQGPPSLFIVADGMGGQLAGEKASSIAVELIPRELTNRVAATESNGDERQVVRAIRDAVASANQEILSLASLETEFANMGTTVVLALFQNGRVFVTGIGDSRCYRLRDDRIEQLTRDHSLADALGEAGTITPEEVPTHKFKNVLYLYLGSKDARGGPEDVRVLDLQKGDRFLLSSDGLTGVVKDDRLAEIMRTCDDPQHAADLLQEEALRNLSKDNITCVVIYVVAA